MQTPLRILYLEDNLRDQELVAEALAADGLACEFTYAKTQKEFERALEQGSVELILSDFTLPSYSGTLALVAAHQRRPEVPFLFVSGTIGEERAVESLKAGATDYVLKGRLTRLPAAVRRALHEAELRRAKNRAEAALRESEERFRQLAENIECVFWMSNAELNGMLYVSPAYERVWGRTPASLYAQPGSFFEAVHPADRTFVLANLEQKQLAQPEEFEIEYRIVRPDGSLRWIRDRGFPIRNAGGQFQRLVGIAEDITERKALEEVQRRLAAAVEQAAEAIVITDVQGAILYVNPAFEKVTGYSRQEALGQNPRLLKSGKQDRAFYARMWGALLQGQVWHGRLVNQRKDGALYEEDVSIGPIRDVTGQIINYVAVQRDVSHEALLQAQLRHAQKMEAIGQLAGGVAHDFNNLLVVISGSAEISLMAPEQLPQPVCDSLKQIVAAAERAANLTRQLMAFSRKQVMQAKPLDLNELIANLIKMLARIIGENIRLQCSYSTRSPFIEADIGMLEQVLVNLVVNARDAMPHGGQLSITTDLLTLDAAQADTRPEARAGEFVRLAVRDSGTGIAPEHLPHIFEPFFTTKEPGQGTGLGLAVVYGIVKQHQGWMEVASQLGAGSTFNLFVPAVPPPAQGAAAPPVEADLPGGREKILLVEDDFAVRRMTERLLETFGYRVWPAASGLEAQEIWRTHAPEIDLLLTDIIMPDSITGRELAEELHEQKSQLKVIFMSGYSAEVACGNPDYARRFKGCFLQKPCSSRTIIEAVRHCLDEP